MQTDVESIMASTNKTFSGAARARFSPPTSRVPNSVNGAVLTGLAVTFLRSAEKEKSLSVPGKSPPSCFAPAFAQVTFHV